MNTLRLFRARHANDAGIAMLATLAILVAAPLARSEEAIDRAGRKYIGRLQRDKDAWVFQIDKNKSIPLDQLVFVRFDNSLTPAPNAPLVRILLLPNGQRVTGVVQKIDEKTVHFISSWGKSFAFKRNQVVGIEQDAAPIVHDDFETLPKSWRIEGTAALSPARAFFGKSSLLLNAPGQSAARSWQPTLRDGAVRLFFHEPANSGRWSIETDFEPARASTPTLVIDKGAYAGFNMKQPFVSVKATPGWHILTIDIENERLRIFVDDHCLGQTNLAAKEAIKGIRIANGGKSGELFVDELLVTRRLSALRRPAPIKGQDIVWLELGEQLFGRVVAADARAVVLDAKFGKRSLPWSQLRGIVFATSGPQPLRGSAEITFRPGPGFALDCVHARLIRWEDAKLIVEHDQLGTFAIERERLDKIRPPAK